MKRFIKLGLVLLTIGMAASCNRSAETKNVVIPLSEMQWDFRQVNTNNWYKANVPGNVISDLKNANAIPDPFYRTNEDSVQWIEKKDWEYQTTFDLSNKQIQYPVKKLQFEGLDTYAEVFLNDQKILSTINMFVGHEVDVSDILKPKDNSLKIVFKSPIKIQQQLLDSLGFLPKSINEIAPDSLKTRIFTRKAPFHYGWDWGPRLVTSGIWRTINLLLSNNARISDVYFKPVSIDTTEAKYMVECEVESFLEKSENQVINIFFNNICLATQEINLLPGKHKYNIPVAISNPNLWWCNGYGDAYLYDVNVQIGVGGRLDSYGQKLGIRDIKLVQERDSVGRTFYFELNGVPIFAKGANYIPSHTLTTEITRNDYNRVLQDALKANMNMLRVWGGAIYEDKIFYNLCDKYGILVWQDFMFSCDNMPPMAYMYKTIAQEAKYNVKRLRNHASLALWCGNNENLGYMHSPHHKDDYTPEQYQKLLKSYDTIYHYILKEAVESFHPEIDYWPSSPAAFPGNKLEDLVSGDEHNWHVWFGREPIDYYTKNISRFVSEYGIQAYPDMGTIDSFSVAGDQYFNSPVMEHRQRSNMNWIREGFNGNHMMRFYMKNHFPEPDNFRSEVYFSQLMQQKAFKTAIEAHRSARPQCMGSLYWQLNDCWPAISWASVDYYGKWKASHFAVREAFKTFLVNPQWNNDKLTVDVVSDSIKGIQGHLVVQKFNIMKPGKLTVVAEKQLTVRKLSALKITFDTIQNKADFGYYFELKNINNGKILAQNILLPTDEKDITFAIPDIEVEKTQIGGKTKLVIKTNVFVKGLCLKSDIEGAFTNNYFDMVPGKAYTIFFIPEGSKTANCNITWHDYTFYAKDLN